MVMCPLLTGLEVETDQHGCPNWTVLFCFSLTIIQERMNKHYIVVKKKKIDIRNHLKTNHLMSKGYLVVNLMH